MRPLGLGPRDVLSLVRGARDVSADAGPIVVSGPDAAAVAAALGADASPGAVVVRSDPVGAAAVVRVLDGPVRVADREVLRAGARAGVPLVALDRAEPTVALPYVLATAVVPWPRGSELPLDELARVLATSVGDDAAASVGARVPVLREHLVRSQALSAATTAAGLALLRGPARALAPVLVLAQARMLRRIAVARGAATPSDPQALATTVGPELAAAAGTSVVARRLVRALPFRSRVLEAAVAFAGTAALAALSGRLPRKR